MFTFYIMPMHLSKLSGKFCSLQYMTNMHRHRWQLVITYANFAKSAQQKGRKQQLYHEKPKQGIMKQMVQTKLNFIMKNNMKLYRPKQGSKS